MDRRQQYNHHRARVASLSRERSSNDPLLVAARIQMWAASSSRYRMFEMIEAIRSVRPNFTTDIVNAIIDISPGLTADERAQVRAAMAVNDNVAR